MQTKVSLFVTLIIVLTSAASILLFTSALRSSSKEGMLERGKALSYALSHAAEEGLIREDLDLLKKASDFIKAPDVILVQVYSDLWEAVDSYPFEKLKDPPNHEARGHFRKTNSIFYVKTANGYDFYRPILFRPFQDSSPVTIGYVRILLSSAIAAELENIIAANIVVAIFIAILAILAINILVNRLVVGPVLTLYGSVADFKNSVMPEEPAVPRRQADEIGALSSEFRKMCITVKEKTDKIVESDRRIRSLFERVDHAIFRTDAEGMIIESNNRFRELFGEAKELCDIFTDRGIGHDCLGKTVPKEKVYIEDYAIGKKGERRLISLALYPEIDSEGAISSFDGYILDITEKKNLEERLFRAQKMEAVGTLASGMAHDFNNLLTAILGYAEIILSTTKEGDPYQRPAQIIYDAAKRGAEFGQKILTITRKEKMETRPVNINDIVDKSMDLLRRSIPKDIDIVTNLQDGLPLTKADSSQLQQVVINLAVNARDAMPEGGKLVIETSLVGQENRTEDAFSSHDARFVKLSVSDTGGGIDTETQRRIFDPFFTTKEKGKGTGLGLYIVHSIVNNHGGYINLYSEPSKGTQFNIYLPVTRDSDNEVSVDVPDISGSGVILVIDDEQDVRELCRDMLEPLGYTLLTAGTGSLGVNAFRDMKEKISLVILDMIMPKMSGREVFEALKTINPDVPILLCSGYTQNGFAGIDELMKRGAAGFIQKPFSRQSLGLAIKRVFSS